MIFTKFNENRSCIEITVHSIVSPLHYSLMKTEVVLKFVYKGVLWTLGYKFNKNRSCI